MPTFTSHEVIRLMGDGAYPAAPKVGFPISDVRDVAATHVLAMTKPEAAGKRFLTANGFLRLIEVGRLVADALPDLQGKVPRRELPDIAGAALSQSSTGASRRCSPILVIRGRSRMPRRSACWGRRSTPLPRPSKPRR